MTNSMTRQHFAAVARFIAEIEDIALRRRVCQSAIRELRCFNDNFDRSRFEKACGVEEQ